MAHERGGERGIWRVVGLKGFELHLINLFVITERIIFELDTALLLVIKSGVVLGCLLLETIVCCTVLEELGDEVLVDDMALELRGRNDVAVSKLEMLNEEARSVECLVTSDTSELLIDFVALEGVSRK
jgi:hypothetical protein